MVPRCRSHQMTERHFLYLKLVYIWGFSLFLFSLFYAYDLSVISRFAILMAAFTPILIAHIKISIDIVAWRTKRIFFILGILWVVRVMSFGIDDGLFLIIGQRISILGWLTDISLLFIAPMIFLSFLLKRPFFFTRTESNIFVFIGILGIILSLLDIIMTTIAIMQISGLLPIYWPFDK